jgi:hypothetical protein
MYGGAIFSDDGLYRHWLWRMWPAAPLAQVFAVNCGWLNGGMFELLNLPYALFIGHNPSKADGKMNDMTVIREIDITKRLGYSCYVKMNVVDRCATDPMELGGDLLGDAGQAGFRRIMFWRAVRGASRIILATGNPHKLIAGMAKQMIEELSRNELWCMGTTADGWPRHPSRLANSTLCIPFKGSPP